MAVVTTETIPFDSSDEYDGINFGGWNFNGMSVPVNNGGTPDTADFSKVWGDYFELQDQATGQPLNTFGQFPMELNLLAYAAQLWQLIVDPFDATPGDVSEPDGTGAGIIAPGTAA